LVFSVLLALVSALYILWPSDEARIRKLFKEGAKAAEGGDVEGIMSKISYNYRDDYGMTYLYLREILKREFGRLTDIQVECEDLTVRILKGGGAREGQSSAYASDRAEAEVNVRVIVTMGNETGYIIGDARAPLHLRFILEKERTTWLIVKTEGLGDFQGIGER